MFYKEILVWKGNISSLIACFYFLLFAFYYQVKISLPLSLFFSPHLDVPHKPVKIALLFKKEKRD